MTAVVFTSDCCVCGRRATAAGVARAAAENAAAKGTLARLQDTSVCLPLSVLLYHLFKEYAQATSVDTSCEQAVTIQKHWRGVEGRSRVSAQLEMEMLALQVEAEAEAENGTADDSTDEMVASGAAAPRTESEVLFAQMEAKAEAEVAAELLQQHATAATEEDEEDTAYLTVMVPDGSSPGDELVLQVRSVATA